MLLPGDGMKLLQCFLPNDTKWNQYWVSLAQLCSVWGGKAGVQIRPGQDREPGIVVTSVFLGENIASLSE